MRWAGLRKVRGQVCKRVRRRLSELGLPDLAAYRDYLEAHPEEWAILEGLTHITISRFNRDRGVFAALAGEVLPELAASAFDRGSGSVAIWSAGCASGEEPYTLAILWRRAVAARFPEIDIRILATDVDAAMLSRARRGCYRSANLRELPEAWRAAALVQRGDEYCLTGEIKAAVRVARHDVREPPPTGPFDLVLCRNLAFTYFDAAAQRAVATHFAVALRPGGALVLGKHEALPTEVEGFAPWRPAERIYRRVGGDGRRITPSLGSPTVA